MSAASRRVARVWVPGLALAAGVYVYAAALSTTLNGLGLLALLAVGMFTVLAARDADSARKGSRHV